MMQARGPLMIEHRLIERMISIVREAIARIDGEGSIEPGLVETAVDFIRTYADRTHHGKEEDILFRELDKRPLSERDRRVMRELIEEHAFGRETVRALVEANARYREGDASALRDISRHLGTLTSFYPRHIEKEDKDFFPASRAYLTQEEDQAMLREFMAFDQRMIHEKYESLVERLESDRP
ncbi:hemerythrin domain-containing protein [Candidatus Fermentibacterales bacterium]|nr:hemerythrin domain-containing protein [Candidatus Fermentibacterales bacterium]